MEKFLKFTYKSIYKPLSKQGGGIFLDKAIEWGLREGVEYIIEDPELLELEKCIIIKSAKFVRVDEITPSYSLLEGGTTFSTQKYEPGDVPPNIILEVEKKIVYKEELISKRNPRLKFGIEADDEPLIIEVQEQVNNFRSYMKWIIENKLYILDFQEEFRLRRGFSLKNRTEFMSDKIEYDHFEKIQYKERIFLAKIQTSTYEPLFQEGFEPKVQDQKTKEVSKVIKRFSLEEMGIQTSFHPIWKSPRRIVGKLTINGQEYKELVYTKGDGEGSYLEDAMYCGMLEMPPSQLSPDEIFWLQKGIKICWVYDLNDLEGPIFNMSSNLDPKLLVLIIDKRGKAGFMEDGFSNKEYLSLVRALLPVTADENVAEKNNLVTDNLPKNEEAKVSLQEKPITEEDLEKLRDRFM